MVNVMNNTYTHTHTHTTLRLFARNKKRPLIMLLWKTLDYCLEIILNNVWVLFCLLYVHMKEYASDQSCIMVVDLS